MNTITNPQKIKQTKGNIPINKDLLNKYPNVNSIFLNEKNNYAKIINVKAINTIPQGGNTTDIYHLAIKIFKKITIKMFLQMAIIK